MRFHDKIVKIINDPWTPTRHAEWHNLIALSVLLDPIDDASLDVDNEEFCDHTNSKIIKKSTFNIKYCLSCDKRTFLKLGKKS